MRDGMSDERPSWPADGASERVFGGGKFRGIDLEGDWL